MDSDSINQEFTRIDKKNNTEFQEFVDQTRMKFFHVLLACNNNMLAGAVDDELVCLFNNRDQPSGDHSYKNDVISSIGFKPTPDTHPSQINNQKLWRKAIKSISDPNDRIAKIIGYALNQTEYRLAVTTFLCNLDKYPENSEIHILVKNILVQKICSLLDIDHKSIFQ